MSTARTPPSVVCCSVPLGQEQWRIPVGKGQGHGKFSNAAKRVGSAPLRCCKQRSQVRQDCRTDPGSCRSSCTRSSTAPSRPGSTLLSLHSELLSTQSPAEDAARWAQGHDSRRPVLPGVPKPFCCGHCSQGFCSGLSVLLTHQESHSRGRTEWRPRFWTGCVLSSVPRAAGLEDTSCPGHTRPRRSRGTPWHSPCLWVGMWGPGFSPPTETVDHKWQEPTRMACGLAAAAAGSKGAAVALVGTALATLLKQGPSCCPPLRAPGQSWPDTLRPARLAPPQAVL